jgi:hypothetical protein
MTLASTPLPMDRDVTCHALQLALVATELRRAWHAGVMDADTAMRRLDLAVREVCSLRAVETAAH